MQFCIYYPKPSFHSQKGGKQISGHTFHPSSQKMQKRCFMDVFITFESCKEFPLSMFLFCTPKIQKDRQSQDT